MGHNPYVLGVRHRFMLHSLMLVLSPIFFELARMEPISTESMLTFQLHKKYNFRAKICLHKSTANFCE